MTRRSAYFWVVLRDVDRHRDSRRRRSCNGSDRAVADSANPFFQTTTGPDGQAVVFKDWTCAQINLSAHVGKMVTVEFVSADCAHSGHWGYAYVDNFCGNCANSPTGDFNFDAAGSSACGPGKLCFDYTLPTLKGPAGPITGTIEIKLEILQNGAVVATSDQPGPSSGTNYCFDIDPAAIGGLDPALDGFDFVADRRLQDRVDRPSPLTVGGLPDGLHPARTTTIRSPAAGSAMPSSSCAALSGTAAAPAPRCGPAPMPPKSTSTQMAIRLPTSSNMCFRSSSVEAATGREPRTVTARAEDRSRCRLIRRRWTIAAA